MPAEGSDYKVSTDELEKTALKAYLKNQVFGEMDIQIGYCYGYSNKLNAFERHKGSEVNIAVTDMILFSDNIREMENEKYNSANAFLAKKVWQKSDQCLLFR